MSTNNSPNNISSNIVYESNSQTIATQAYDTYTSFNNSISDQPLSNTYLQQPNVAYNHQQQYDNSNNNPYTIHQQPGIPNNNDAIDSNQNYHHNYQQPMSNVASDNNVPISSDNHHAVHALSNHINQQPTPNNISPPQFHYDQNQNNLPQSNILPLLNSHSINIYSPQTTIIIMPTTNSGNQN
ncbi:hypothetical protein RclHR1_01610020 [Rhizophagus clarus]|uniref:Uncharacterized protein n=1 Tax=Rhizophagus clarus TaxID=94130 RepID=A0A2Z6QUF4_9GLOM|nr:hypothetical protein RclHR1_01610020 [Rhizophagus clarus]GES98070.1 hypothetical protein GLOIN_2v1880782 [Rhizophagus clarus]